MKNLTEEQLLKKINEDFKCAQSICGAGVSFFTVLNRILCLCDELCENYQPSYVNILDIRDLKEKIKEEKMGSQRLKGDDLYDRQKRILAYMELMLADLLNHIHASKS